MTDFNSKNGDFQKAVKPELANVEGFIAKPFVTYYVFVCSVCLLFVVAVVVVVVVVTVVVVVVVLVAAAVGWFCFVSYCRETRKTNTFPVSVCVRLTYPTMKPHVLPPDSKLWVLA